tara:strand:- start:65834 stop:66214 length:381 start_codon:yes stop_codon:yes gene_type:complete
MAFLKRLGLFLVGLSIGIVFLTYFLKKKTQDTGTEFCYFPNCRVLKDLRSKPLHYSDEIKTAIENDQIDSTAIAHFLREGSIDFGKSDTKSVPCRTYLIEGTVQDAERVLEVHNCPTKVLVQRLLP